MKTALASLLILLLACNSAAESDAARERAKLQASDDPEDAVKLANLEWRVLGEVDAARARLVKLATSPAHIELARIALVTNDYATARAEARRAIAAAAKKRDVRRAWTLLADVVVRDPKSTTDELREVVASLRAILASDGPYLQTARMLTRAALRAGDGAAALEGIDGYYHVSKFSGPPVTIAAGHATLARMLPSWKGGAEIAPALAAIRFFEEAAIVAPQSEFAAYAAALKRIELATNEYYRQIALGHEDDGVLRDAVKREKLDEKRFGTYPLIGKTGNHVDLHLGHVVVDKTMRVEQYGRAASVRFVALDSMVSNGYSEWWNDGRSGDGGWGTAKEIYQVRPRYANGPLQEWALVTDPVERAEDDKKAAKEIALRLRRQYLDATYAKHPSRDAFLARVEEDHFTSSILLHEGRHAIDQASGKKYKTWELEYRAKLSEIALAPAPREALASVLDNDIGGDTPHGKANGKLMEGLEAWMKAHGVAAVDKLTDEQIRTAVRSLDPLAK